MSEKKRKSTSKEEERPAKKQQVGDTIKVSHIQNSHIAKPIVAHSPGIKVTEKVKFTPYERRPLKGNQEILLHSTNHPRIDYTATEGHSSNDKYNKHYVAVFDPASGKLQVTEAKHLVVRSSIRQIEPARKDDADDEDLAKKAYTSRAALTEAFGTKKSKKAVQSMAENRQLAQAGESASIANAMMEHVLEHEEEEADSVTARASKPLPKANLTTDDIAQVYPMNELVFPKPSTDTLEKMPIQPWIARLKAKKEIKTFRSRFVANRVSYIGLSLLSSPDASDPMLKQCIQILRYLELLIQIHTFVSRAKPRARIPYADKIPPTTFSEGVPVNIIEQVLKHFFHGERTPTDHAKTLLRTTILALTLHIPPPSLKLQPGTLISEITDIGLDLALDATELRKLYRELGCKVEGAKEKELSLWGLEKIKAKKDMAGHGPMFAKLKFPIEFPKISRGRAPKQRR